MGMTRIPDGINLTGDYKYLSNASGLIIGFEGIGIFMIFICKPLVLKAVHKKLLISMPCLTKSQSDEITSHNNNQGEANNLCSSATSVGLQTVQKNNSFDGENRKYKPT